MSFNFDLLLELKQHVLLHDGASPERNHVAASTQLQINLRLLNPLHFLHLQPLWRFVIFLVIPGS